MMIRQTDNIQNLDKFFSIKNRLYDARKKLPSSKTVFRIANILICINHGITSLTDIAKACNVNKSTMHRLLAALCEAHMVMQNPSDQRYTLGHFISEMAVNPQVTHESLIVCAAHEMRALADYTGETVGLAGLIGFQQISLFEVPSVHDFRIVVRKKFTDNMHAGATSRILLSQLDKTDFKLVVANLDFKQITEATITYKEQWLALVKQAGEQGYSISIGERILGGSCISVPIKDYLFPLSLDVAGPEARMKPRVNEFLAELLACAGRIQENIKQMQLLTTVRS